MSFGKFLRRHVKQVQGLAKKTVKTLKANDPLKQMGGMMGGGMMGGRMGQQQGGNANTDAMAGNADTAARSQAAQAMKRQAGSAQISFSGDQSTPASSA